MLEVARGCFAGARFKTAILVSCLSAALIRAMTLGASAGVQGGGGPGDPKMNPTSIPSPALCPGCVDSKVCIATYLSQKLSVFLSQQGCRQPTPVALARRGTDSHHREMMSRDGCLGLKTAFQSR